MANDWVIDPSNPNRATYTDPSGTVHEAFREAPAPKKPAPVQYEASPNGYVPSPGARMGPAKGQEAVLKGEERGIGDYFNEAYERATSMAGTGEIGALARGMEDLFNIDDRYEQGLRGGTPEQREDARDQERVNKVRQTRALWSALDELDPAWRKDGTTLGNVARFSAQMLGDIAGNANPSYMIGGGATVAERMAVQGAANAGIDAALQGNELRTGIQDEFDPRRMALQFLAGAAIQGGLEGGIRGGKAISDAFNPKVPEIDFDPALHPRETIEVEGIRPDELTETDFANEMQDALLGGAPQEFIDDIYRRYGKTPESRSVSSDYGADAEFRPADEAFTDSLVTGRPVESAAPDSVLRDPVSPELREYEDLGTDEVFGRLDGSKAEGQDVRTYDTNELQELLRRRASEGAFDAPEVKVEASAPEAGSVAVSRDEVLSAISDKTKTWKNAPEFEVVERVDQIADPKMRAAVDDPSVIGFYGEDGKVRIISGNLRDKSEIAPAMFHEALGHHGLSQKFGDNLDVMMQRLYDKTPELQKAVDDWRAEYGSSYGDVPITTQVEEVLAKMSEKKELTQSIIDKVKDFIKNYARQIGIDLDYSNREVMSILASAHDAVTRGAKTAETPSGTRFIRSADTKGRTEINESTSGFLDRFTFKHTTPNGEEIVGSYSYNPDKKIAYNLSLGGVIFDGPNSFGPRTIRDMAQALKEKHPGIKSIEGTRISGARNSSVDNPNRFQNVRADLTRFMKRPPERPTLEGDFDPNAEIRSSEELDRAIREIAKGVKTTPQTWAETDALAGDLGLKPSEVAKRRRIDVEEVPQLITAMVETMERQQTRVRDIAEKVRNGDDSSATLARAAQQIAVLADILPTVMRLRSASGRALNTFAQLSKDGRNPTDFLEALKDFGHDGQPMDKDSIIKLLTNISEINDPTAAARLATDAFKPRAEDVIFSLWYNINLLSRPSTQYNNFMGTMENVLFELGAKTLAVPMGQVRKAMGNTDRVAAREVLSRVAGATIGALQGIKNAPLAFKLAMPITGVSKEAYRPAPIMDIAKDITKNSSKAVRVPTLGVAGALETTSRVMAMADEFFRSVAHTSEQWGQATREALKDDGPGSFGEKVYRYNKSPTEARIPKRRLETGMAKYSDPVNERRWEIYDEAKSQADIATFRDMSSPLMKRYEDIMRPKEGDTVGARTGRFAMRVLVPFARMGDAMTRSKIRMTPLIGMLDRYNKADWAAGGARRDVVVGRMAIGLGLGALAASQVLNGERSGNGPSDYDLRMEMEAGGWKPNAVRQADGSWQGKQGLGAVNTYMNTVASLTEALAADEMTQDNYDKKITEAFGKVMASFVKDAGVENLVNIVSADPESSGLSNAFGGLASSFASPGILQSYNQYIEDTSVRSAIDADAPASGRDRGPGEIMRGRVRSAWGDETLPQKYDVYGREKERPGGWLNMLTGGRYGEPETDEAVLELQRLAKGRDKALINMPEKTLGLGSGDDRIEKKLTEAEFQKYIGLSGYYIREIVREQMKTPEWKKMSDAERVDVISKPRDGIKAFARKAAREYLFIERNDDPLPPEEETPIEEEALIE